MTSKQVHDDNEVMSNTMYKLLKKYQAIKQIVKTLHDISISFTLAELCGGVYKSSYWVARLLGCLEDRSPCRPEFPACMRVH